MSWSWTYENADGEVIGTSPTFGSRGDAETWVGEAFADLADDGVAQVTLFDGEARVYGPMSLAPE